MYIYREREREKKNVISTRKYIQDPCSYPIPKEPLCTRSGATLARGDLVDY